MRTTAGTHAGRSHRARAIPCQDAYAVHEDPEHRRMATALADGLGSRPLSHLGSQAATEAAVAHLAGEPTWDEAALRRAFQAAADAVAEVAARQGLRTDELATTLQVACLQDGHALAAMVGDGAVVAAGPDAVQVLLPPPTSTYANEVVPLTAGAWPEHWRFAQQDGATALLAFTDGLTRLLLTRSNGTWGPYQPFYDSFLPQVEATPFKADLASRFVADERVDQSWDDDKCLVVLSHAGDV